MHVVTLIANPARPRLDAATVEALRNAWGGGSARWLNPGVAAEFDLAEEPGNFWQVWADLQALELDLALQPAAGRRKAMLLADMDSTMIEQECIDELADLAGFGAHVAAITARAMNGELEFEPALRERVALFAGMDEGIIARVLAERITFTPGGKALIATMKAHGAHAALVSGGFTAFTAHVAEALAFDEHHANLLLAEDGKLSGQVAEPILGRQAKVDALEAITANVVHVGASGAGAVAKLANNLLVAAHLLTAAEALRLARKAGVEAEAALAVINAASGRSAATEVNFPRWILPGGFDSGFTAGLMRKDVRLALELAGRAGAMGTLMEEVGRLWLQDSAVPDGEDFNRVAAELWQAETGDE